MNSCYFTNFELCCLYCNFGHLSLYCLYQLLKQLRHNIKLEILKYFTKYYGQCQKYSQLPEHFAFTLKIDLDFNFNIIINIMYIKKKPVLHLADKKNNFKVNISLKCLNSIGLKLPMLMLD